MHDFVKEKGIPHETYFANFRLIDGLAKGEVDAAMVWAPALTVAKKERGIDLQMVAGYVPAPGQRWNLSAVPCP